MQSCGSIAFVPSKPGRCACRFLQYRCFPPFGEDIDPWPGLKQQFDTVKEMTTSILTQLVIGRGDEPGTQQVISSEDALSSFRRRRAAARATLLPGISVTGPDRTSSGRGTGWRSAAAGDQPPVPSAHGLRVSSGARARATRPIHPRVCPRGALKPRRKCEADLDRREGWRSFCVVGDDLMNQRAEGVFSLHAEPLLQRPSYSYLEACINSELPDPAWRRAMK